MNFQTEPEQEALAASLRNLFQDRSSPAAMRALWSTGTGRSPLLWRQLAEIGLPAILVPDRYGGAGGSISDLCVAMEEVGRCCVPDALVEACVVAPSAILLAGDDAQRSAWLPGIASGEIRATAALEGAPAVPDAHVCDLVIIEVGNELRLLQRTDREDIPLASMDPSRRLFRVSPLPDADAALAGFAHAQAEIRAYQQLAHAAVLVGLAQAMLDQTVTYVTVRHQFGRAIGSFQAVKHQLAEATSLVTLARIAVRAASARVVAAEPGAHRAARLARICAGDAEREANRVALQLHGGIGFTWENDLQMWLKRGKAFEQADGGHHALTQTAGEHTIATLQPNRRR